tara:strand:- start:275 stop:700 length:426 start_codon:yes stop_codon:yes gene_type:complete
MPAIENYISYSEGHVFINVIAYEDATREIVSKPKRKRSRSVSKTACPAALDYLTTHLQNIKTTKSFSPFYSVTPCDFRGSQAKGDGRTTHSAIAASELLLHFYPYPGSKIKSDLYVSIPTLDMCLHRLLTLLSEYLESQLI